MTDKRLTQTMLLDFYGDLLTEKQRDCYRLHCDDDLSLSEIAEQCGISRQGVRDTIKRAEASLVDYEDKTGIIGRFLATKDSIDGIIKYTSEALVSSKGNNTEAFTHIIDMLKELKEKV